MQQISRYLKKTDFEAASTQKTQMGPPQPLITILDNFCYLFLILYPKEKLFRGLLHVYL